MIADITTKAIVDRYIKSIYPLGTTPEQETQIRLALYAGIFIAGCAVLEMIKAKTPGEVIGQFIQSAKDNGKRLDEETANKF